MSRIVLGPLFCFCLGLAGSSILAAQPGAGVAPEALVAPRSAGDGPPPRQEAAKPALDERIAAFLEQFYLSGEDLSPEQIVQLYAPQVAYFGNRLLERQQVIADKRAYFTRWPHRTYRLLRDTLKVTSPPGEPRIYQVSFDYIFDVKAARRASRGRGRAHLTLDMRLAGGTITRETGTVLERW